MSFGSYCASSKFISIGPKRYLETNSSKKANFPVISFFWPNFSHIIECNKPQGTFYRGRKVVFTITLEVRRSFV